VAGRIRSIECSGLIGDRARDLLACSIFHPIYIATVSISSYDISNDTPLIKLFYFVT
jgi:hypothetical protein